MREIQLLREDVRDAVVPEKLEILPGQIVGVPALNTKRKRIPDSLFLKSGHEGLKCLHEGGKTCHFLFVQIFKLKLGEEYPVMNSLSCIEVSGIYFSREEVRINDQGHRFVPGSRVGQRE